MPKLTPPSLPPGPRQILSVELHTLHRRAGWPSVRDLSRALGAGVASSSRIHDAFTKPRLPDWGLVKVLVIELAQQIPRTDPGTESDRFHALWEAAAEASTETADVPAAPASPDLKPPPLVLPPAAVPPARITSVKTQSAPGSRSDSPARRTEHPIDMQNLKNDPTVASPIVERLDELLPLIIQARAALREAKNSDLSRTELNVLASRISRLHYLEEQVRRMRLRYSRIAESNEIEEELRELRAGCEAIFSEIQRLTQPLYRSLS
ncbi:hypothetical protein ACFY8C_38360 [Streptomyces flavochromogenes]|uniref:Uncharacterized protein n=1 Tax=Streptomyces flavochromogenes TaxID=68199 RepID=A0ABW6Y2Z5_9ACTN